MRLENLKLRRQVVHVVLLLWCLQFPRIHALGIILGAEQQWHRVGAGQQPVRHTLLLQWTCNFARL